MSSTYQTKAERSKFWRQQQKTISWMWVRLIADSLFCRIIVHHRRQYYRIIWSFALILDDNYRKNQIDGRPEDHRRPTGHTTKQNHEIRETRSCRLQSLVAGAEFYYTVTGNVGLSAENFRPGNVAEDEATVTVRTRAADRRLLAQRCWN